MHAVIGRRDHVIVILMVFGCLFCVQIKITGPGATVNSIIAAMKSGEQVAASSRPKGHVPVFQIRIICLT